MSSERDNRARAAARARLERQMAARREAHRRRRLLQARIAGGVAGFLVVAAIVWISVAALTGGGETTPQASGACAYPEQFSQPTDQPTTDPSVTGNPSAAASPTPSPLPEGIVDVGHPVTDPPRTGFQVITFETNLGTIQVEMDLSKTPCTSNSIAFLASHGFYDHTGATANSCHRIVPDRFALQCGDPTGTGYGGPNYTFRDENLQTGKLPAYHTGDVAMANGGPGTDTNSAQFFFVYGTSSLQGDYPLWGKVISGMEFVEQVAAGGIAAGGDTGQGDGPPAVNLIFNKVTAGPITPASVVTVTPTPSATPTPAASTPTPSTPTS